MSPSGASGVTRVDAADRFTLDLGELWRFRGLLGGLASRDLKLRYKQTVLGAGWVILQPVIGALIFTFLFGVVAELDAGVPHFLFALVGMAGWKLFDGNLTRISNVLLTNAGLVSKIYFPRLILPLSPTLTSLVDLGISLAVVAVALVAYGLLPGAAVLLVPLWLLMILATAVGLGLIFTSLGVFYRDVRNITPILVQMLLFLSPVGYPADEVKAKLPDWGAALYMLNPLAAPLQGLHWSVLGTTAPTPVSCVYAAAISLGILATGVMVFSTTERRFADVI